MDVRYEFGGNWARYVRQLPQNALESAQAGLAKHVGKLRGYSFLDVGSGSGLMSAAALKSGARRVLAFDYDPVAVTTSQQLLKQLAPNGDWEVRRGNVLTDSFGEWDVVYAWGVLHHTGDVTTALRRSAALVASGGRLVVGIYKRTPLCGFWAREKRWYSQAPAWQRLIVRWTYLPGLLTAWTLKGTLIQRLRAQERGMSIITDADDWLGGYPYESMTLDEIKEIILPLGFEVEAEFPIPDRGLMGMGWVGTGCQTVRFRRR